VVNFINFFTFYMYLVMY